MYNSETVYDWFKYETAEVAMSFMCLDLVVTAQKQKIDLGSHLTNVSLDIDVDTVLKHKLSYRNIKMLELVYKQADLVKELLVTSISERLDSVKSLILVDSISSRVKNAASVYSKIERRGVVRGIENIDDLVGVRIVVLNEMAKKYTVEALENILVEQSHRLFPKMEGDSSVFINHVNSASGYTACHISFFTLCEIPLVDRIGCEIQVRTAYEDFGLEFLSP